MSVYAIVLEPEQKLYKKISNLKETAKRIAGNHQYLDDKPHITLYVGNFVDHSEWEQEICNISLKWAMENHAFKAELSGWRVFRDDEVTGNNSLTVGIADSTSEFLRKLQSQIVAALNTKRKPSIFHRYKGLKKTANEHYKSNIEKFGYPFIGVHWIPHLSIASFTPDKFDKVFNKLRNTCPKGFYILDSLVIYQINPKTESLIEIARQKLN